ncbi:MAG: hypothetical protein KME29_36055 [Calothrix sp. FI2-JRJ7]|nr:hypothetical protein [Calothrix sp. FI2-JRJ7]
MYQPKILFAAPNPTTVSSFLVLIDSKARRILPSGSGTKSLELTCP